MAAADFRPRREKPDFWDIVLALALLAGCLVVFATGFHV